MQTNAWNVLDGPSKPNPDLATRADSQAGPCVLPLVRPPSESGGSKPRPPPPGEEQLCLREEAPAGPPRGLAIGPLSAVAPPGKVPAPLPV